MAHSKCIYLYKLKPKLMNIKILLSLFTFLSFSIISKAQIEKGKYLLGGSISFYNEKSSQPYSDRKVSLLNSSLQFGKVIKNNTVAGLIGSYSHNTYYNSSNYIDTTKMTQVGAGVFYRKYKKIGDLFYFFWEGDALYAYSKDRRNYSQSKSERILNSAVIRLIPGLSYAVKKKLQIELVIPDIFSVSYSAVKSAIQNDLSMPAINQKGHLISVSSNLNANLLANFGIGFKFLLGK